MHRRPNTEPCSEILCIFGGIAGLSWRHTTVCSSTGTPGCVRACGCMTPCPSGFIITALGKRDLFILDQHASDEKYNFEALHRYSTDLGACGVQGVCGLQGVAEAQCLRVRAQCNGSGSGPVWGSDSQRRHGHGTYSNESNDPTEVGTVHSCAEGGGGGQCYRVPGQPLLNRHQVGGVSRSPDGLFAQQEREPIRGTLAVRGKRTYGGRPGQRVEEQGTWASRTQKHSEAGYGRPVDRGAWTAKTAKRPRQQSAHPQYANYWAPLTRKRHTMPHAAQPQHTNYWAPRTRKRHQQEHRPQRPTESCNPTQHAKGRTGDFPGPRKGATTRRNVTQGVNVWSSSEKASGVVIPHRKAKYQIQVEILW